MAGTCGSSFGRSAMTTASTFATAYPAARTICDGALEQRDAVRALPFRIGIGKMLADIARRGRAENRIGHRVAQHVGIRMAGEPGLVRNLHAANDERPARLQAVQIVAGTDSHRRHGPRSRPSSRRFQVQAPGQRLRHAKIQLGRDLDVRRLALDQAHRMARLLGEGGLVGRRSRMLARPARIASCEHLAGERLRRLRQVDRIARRSCVRRCAGPAPPSWLPSRCRWPAEPQSRLPRLGRLDDPRKQFRATRTAAPRRE